LVGGLVEDGARSTAGAIEVGTGGCRRPRTVDELAAGRSPTSLDHVVVVAANLDAGATDGGDPGIAGGEVDGADTGVLDLVAVVTGTELDTDAFDDGLQEGVGVCLLEVGRQLIDIAETAP